MNNGQLVTAVLTRTNGNDTTDGVLTTAIVKSFILEALNAIEVEKDWDWLDAVTTFPTVAGTDTYAPAATVARTRHLRVTTTGFDLDYVSLEEADRYIGDGAATGQPVVFTFDSGNLILRPVPDAVYTLQHRYTVTETALSGDSDSPLMPARFHWVIVQYACALAYELIGKELLADRCMARYQQWVARMRDDRSRVSRPGQIRVVEPGGW